ncbi:MAG: hypothetical protein AAFR61_10005 [Bacteroidota bacterium]
MIRTIFFLLCLGGWLNTQGLQAQQSISVGLTYGWGIGLISGVEESPPNLLEINNFFVAPAGLQFRWAKNDRWAFQARGLLYRSSFRIWQWGPDRLLTGWTDIENRQGGLEVSALRRIPLSKKGIFLALEGGLSLQAHEIGREGCATVATAPSVNPADSLFQTTKVYFQGQPLFLSGHFRLNLEYDFRLLRAPVTMVASLNANHALFPAWRAETESWEALPLETAAFQPFPDRNPGLVLFQPIWTCETEVMDTPDATTNTWQNNGLSFGLQLSLLFNLTRLPQGDD